MYKFQLNLTLFGGLLLLSVYSCVPVPTVTPTHASSWRFAIASKTRIHFYDDNWHEIYSWAHVFKELSALTFDETEDIIYFSDQEHKDGSIFSLKIPLSSASANLENVMERTQNELIRGMAYDPLNRTLYWSDAKQRKIFFTSVDIPEAVPAVLVDFSKEKSIPDGLAIDACRRKLYWTNSNYDNATVESIELDGSDRKVIVSSDLYMPHGIVVDQQSSRIYFVVAQQGVHFSVESAKLDGSDRYVIARGLDNMPFNLAVTRDAVYWTDSTHNAIWSLPKHSIRKNLHEEIIEQQQQPQEAQKVVVFDEKTRGIVARNNFFQTLRKNEACAAVVEKIETRLKQTTTRSTVEQENDKIHSNMYCLNNGTFVHEKDICICHMGFNGRRCEVSECQNFCVHGTCTVSSTGFPKCYCQEGFEGERCELHQCTDYCMNGGNCRIDGNNGERSCECADNFGGARCEKNSTEICSLFCRLLKHEPETYVPFGCHDICQSLAQLSEGGTETYAIPRYQHLEVCRNASVWNAYVIITIVAGVVSCFVLIAIIVHGLRRNYKPARPRIKKTFVVRKQARTNSANDTPLTNRPLTTEQCEITIENCCNMNICETPCFDPKLVEQTFARDAKVSVVKEDKKMLIQHMEDELY